MYQLIPQPIAFFPLPFPFSVCGRSLGGMNAIKTEILVRIKGVESGKSVIGGDGGTLGREEARETRGLIIVKMKG